PERRQEEQSRKDQDECSFRELWELVFPYLKPSRTDGLNLRWTDQSSISWHANALGAPKFLVRGPFDFFFRFLLWRSHHSLFHVAAECPHLTATAKSFSPGLHPPDRGRCQDVFWSVVADANLPSARSGSRQETNNDGIVNHIR
ncbi:hypothetical protein, partial [Rhodococcus erythropolis]|uniref:hypothetical protein n=1 Tax=Rhodococcus erythropolis TaxID=1833 RepID=UPI001C6FC80B